MNFSPIAIVGRSCILPGALDPQGLWDLVATSRDLISSAPKGRWGIDHNRILSLQGGSYADVAWSDRGGYVEGFEPLWKPSGFGVSEKELAGLDWLVYWVLHTARETLRDVGDERSGSVDRPRTGAIFGNLGFPSELMAAYARNIWMQDGSTAVDPRNRFMSFVTVDILRRSLGLGAGTFSVDAACASSLYAIKLACDKLHDGDADLMLAGAVQRADDLFLHVGFSVLGALSRSGRSRPFHLEADGLLPAEGAAFVALERLEDAQRNGHRIHGIIRGIGLSNDGRGKGLLVPSEEGQQRAIRAAYIQAGFGPELVSLIEAHATGTQLGDAAEIRSTAAVFSQLEAIPLGSLKSNLGHLITVAGVAGLIKILGAMRANQRPATLHVDQPNAALSGSPFRLLHQLEPWVCKGPKVAAVSAFGFGGNNAHLIVSDDSPELDQPRQPRQAAPAIAVVGLGCIVAESSDRSQFTEALFSNRSLLNDQGEGQLESIDLGLTGLRFPPADLAQTLPQQLAILRTAREALYESAGLPQERTGTYIGMEPDPEVARWGLRWRLTEARDAIVSVLESASVVGSMPNIPANRLSSQFDLWGPSFTIQAGPASGTTALSLAIRALESGELDSAIVGAVDLSCEAVHRSALATLSFGKADPAGDAAITLVLTRLDLAEKNGSPVLAFVERNDPAILGKKETAGEAILTPGQAPVRLALRFGRSFAASGLVHVAAATLALHHRRLPGGQPWLPSDERPRQAIVAVLGSPSIKLQEAPGQPRLADDHPPRLRCFGGSNRQAVIDALLAGREGLSEDSSARLVLLASDDDFEPIRNRALSHLQNQTPAGSGIHFRPEPLQGKMAFFFTGAGAAYRGMGRDLLERLPDLATQLARQSPKLLQALAWSFGEEDHKPTVLEQLWGSSSLSQLHARFTLGLLGLTPDAWLGCSSGESNALLASGIWTDADALIEDSIDSELFTRHLGGCFSALAQAWNAPIRWASWTILAPPSEVQAASDEEERVHLAIIHSSEECVISGDESACERIVRRMGQRRCLRLHYPLAVHVPELSLVREAWLALHRRPTSPAPANTLFYANATGRTYLPSSENCAQAILQQAEGTLDLRPGILSAWEDGVRIFIEHGPQAAFGRWIPNILGHREHLVVSLDRKGQGIEATLDAVAALIAAGVPMGDGAVNRLNKLLTGRDPWIPSGRTLSFPAHWPKISLSSQLMSPAPTLPLILDEDWSTSDPAFVSNPLAAVTGSPHLQAFISHSARLSQIHRDFLVAQESLHERFLSHQGSATEVLLRAARHLPAATRTSHCPTNGPCFTRQQLEVHAGGRISNLFGPRFLEQDVHERQVRMPLPPLLLTDRVTGLSAEPATMGKGTIWTETDISPSAWYLHQGFMPAGILIEAGQADLMLISYLGIDLLNQGQRVYRLLGCELTYHGDLPRTGDTLCFEIHIDDHAAQGAIRLMFFHYFCHNKGKPQLTVREAQAGFFTDEELAASAGCLWTPEEQSIVQSPRLAPPFAAKVRSSFSRPELEAFARGDTFSCFGTGFELAKTHTRSPQIPTDQLLLLDRIVDLNTTGGPWGRGTLRAELDIHPRQWFFEGHFKNDPCMPGTLMFEGCLQAMSFYLTALGFTLPRDGWRFQPVPELPYRIQCRGQVTPASHCLVTELFVEELISDPVPTLYADLLCTIDGLKAFHARQLAIELVPDWPLETMPELISEAKPDGQMVATVDGFCFDYASLIACALGRPSRAFGPMYTRFDGPMRVPRLPSPPYHFMSRVTEINGAIGVMKAGASVTVQYDIPPDAWYFAENGARTMPFAVLLEAALQPCGWLSSYIGSALSVKEELGFRNLDGTGQLLHQILPHFGPLTTQVKLTDISSTGAMIIESFEVSCSLGEKLIYTMKTVFGFFPPAALASQAGLPVSGDTDLLTRPSTFLVHLNSRPPTYFDRARPRLAGPKLLMIDRIDGFWPDAGRAGLGQVRAVKDVDAGEWFFKAHFFQDPVQPGSLGIEAMIQTLQFTMLEKRMDTGIPYPRFESLATGMELTWKYRGQVLPHHRTVHTTLEMTAAGRDDQGAWATCDASLWADGKRIYEATGLGMRIVPGQPEGNIFLNPEIDRWLLDHCPTWTVPALPMMHIVELLAGATGDDPVIGLRDVRVKDWVILDKPCHLCREEKGEITRLLTVSPEGEVEVARGRVLRGPYPLRPVALPPLQGSPVALPYETGALFHGPAFQILERLVMEPGKSSSRLHAESSVPGGILNPALLDGASHGIPHADLHSWDEAMDPGKVAYPAAIPEIDFYGHTPRGGSIRCEVRQQAFLGSPDYPVFLIQLISDEGVWCQLRLIERCFPKGPIGCALPSARRAFLRDRIAADGIRLSQTDGDSTCLNDDEVAATDWLPGTVTALYGTHDTAEIARAEHVAAAHRLHPGRVFSQLPLTRFDLELKRTGKQVCVKGDPHGRLDLSKVQPFWSRWFNRGPWPAEDLYYGLISRFVDRVVLEDPASFYALSGQSALYLANHQTGVESLLFSIIASALSEVPTVTLAKIEHRNTWLGKLIRLCFDYPGITDPGVMVFFDREDKMSLTRVIADLASEMKGSGRSVMVHVEGTRSLSCRNPVEKMSGAFLDMALEIGVPVFPVRFIGGLPVEPVRTRLEFPVGMGRQEIHIGKPFLPEELKEFPYGIRKERIISSINRLGVANSQEKPLPGDPEFARRVAVWQETRGIPHERATLHEILAEIPNSTEEIQRLLKAQNAQDLAGDSSPEGRWLAELGEQLLGSKPKQVPS